MDAHGVPGAAVFVVSEGKVFFEGAFGYSDIERRIRFDFEKTVFAAGSLSKIFTAAAVLRLAESKKIILDSPVSNCLASAGGPSVLSELPFFKSADKVTPMSLLTHSSGFANCSFLYQPARNASYSVSARSGRPRGASAAGRSVLNHPEPSAASAGSYISADMFREPSAPRRAFGFISENAPRFDPEKVNRRFEYSNFNYALLGYLIEESENIDFAEYMKNNIFTPLGMARSSFSPFYFFDNTALTCEAELACGYDASAGASGVIPLKEHNMPAASGLLTCAADVEKFTLALLASVTRESSVSRASAVAIPSRDAARPAPRSSVSAPPPSAIFFQSGSGPASLMFTPRLAVKRKDAAPLDKFPPIDSMAAGFRHCGYRGRHVYWHTGSVRGFSCGIYIIPETASAFFVACNSSNASFRQELAAFVLDAPDFAPGRR